MKTLLIAALILLSQSAHASELIVPYEETVRPISLSDSVGKWTAINNAQQQGQIAQQQEQRAQQQFERDQQQEQQYQRITNSINMNGN